MLANVPYVLVEKLQYNLSVNPWQKSHNFSDIDVVGRKQLCWLYWLHGGYGNQYIIHITFYHWYGQILWKIVLIILIKRRVWKSIYHTYYIQPLIQTDI